MTKGVYYGGGRKKLNLSPEEWKRHKAELEKARRERKKDECWERVVTEILVDYIEEKSIKEIAKAMRNKGYRLSIVENKPDRAVLTSVGVRYSQGNIDSGRCPKDSDLFPIRVMTWYERDDLDSLIDLNIPGNEKIRRAVKAILMAIKMDRVGVEVSGFTRLLGNTLHLNEKEIKKVKKILSDKGFLLVDEN